MSNLSLIFGSDFADDVSGGEHVPSDVSFKFFSTQESAATDYLAVQRLRDERTTVDQFEKRVHDLKLTRTMILQTLPQIRLLQFNNAELVNKIQSTLLNTLPIWKNQIVLALGLQKQRRAAGIQMKIFETTNELLIKNSKLLKDNSLEVARLSEEGIVDTATLETVNEDLITTVSDVLQIYKEGREKRALAERELLSMETRPIGVLSHVTE